MTSSCTDDRRQEAVQAPPTHNTRTLMHAYGGETSRTAAGLARARPLTHCAAGQQACTPRPQARQPAGTRRSSSLSGRAPNQDGAPPRKVHSPAHALWPVPRRQQQACPLSHQGEPHENGRQEQVGVLAVAAQTLNPNPKP